LELVRRRGRQESSIHALNATSVPRANSALTAIPGTQHQVDHRHAETMTGQVSRFETGIL
jgi:hypothetical protein